MCDKKRDYLCKTHSALFVRLCSLGCESSHSRGHDNELVHPLELKLSWKGKLARRRFNFVCALSFMRFTGLLDRTLSNRGTKRTFGAMLQTEGVRGRASKWPFQSVGAKQLTRKPQIQVGTSRIEMPQGSREKLEKKQGDRTRKVGFNQPWRWRLLQIQPGTSQLEIRIWVLGVALTQAFQG